jgi:hypothetical protein
VARQRGKTQPDVEMVGMHEQSILPKVFTASDASAMAAEAFHHGAARQPFGNQQMFPSSNQIASQGFLISSR